MKVVAAPLPEAALLRAYAERGALVDCWALTLPHSLDLTDYLLGFAHSWLFQLERRVLGWAGHPTTASDVQALAMGSAQDFAIWRVEARVRDQLLMAVQGGRIRSWWMAERLPGGGTRLLFGSALLPRPGHGRWQRFGLAGALVGLHHAYARALLAAAARRLTASAGGHA
ncbi:hypothetical protein KAK07_19855 [Ideonella sp. 4Y16]|uniref:Uncharacterized protein n=1 Tax=Ideonella alba TaxID=2824118 RepID=A0A940YLR3_9BURK|nr:hypothetical protein [Ideonella alba]MBQ0932114.1 hypothetical protein [Ideonella alba]MBQ0945605.1 hypothetical protein [Ideonella alba]